MTSYRGRFFCLINNHGQRRRAKDKQRDDGIKLCLDRAKGMLQGGSRIEAKGFFCQEHQGPAGKLHEARSIFLVAFWLGPLLGLISLNFFSGTIFYFVPKSLLNIPVHLLPVLVGLTFLKMLLSTGELQGILVLWTIPHQRVRVLQTLWSASGCKNVNLEGTSLQPPSEHGQCGCLIIVQ